MTTLLKKYGKTCTQDIAQSPASKISRNKRC